MAWTPEDDHEKTTPELTEENATFYASIARLTEDEIEELEPIASTSTERRFVELLKEQVEHLKHLQRLCLTVAAMRQQFLDESSEDGAD